MHARVSFYDLGGASPDDAKQAFEGAREALSQMQGSQGGLLLVNEDEGKAMTITLWENEAALRASDQQADQTRQQAVSRAGMTVSRVEAYQVALEFDR